MDARVRTGLATVLSGLAVLPGPAAAQSLEPAVALEAPAPVRALGAFVLVLVFGGALLYMYEDVVDRSIEQSMDRPLVSVAYGLMAQAAGIFLFYYAISQVSQAGGAAVDVATVAGVVLAGTLAGWGLTVVGISLTERLGERSPTQGLVVGAAIGGVVWLVPALTVSAVLTVVVVAAGIGGPVEAYFHARKDEEIEAEV